MDQFDPALRRETHVYIETFTDPKGRKLYRRARYNLVEYDGDPNKILETRPPSDTVDLFGTQPATVDQRATGRGLMAAAEYYTARPFERQSFGDNCDLP